MKKIAAAFFLFLSALPFSAQLDCNWDVREMYDLTGGPCDNFGTLLDARSDLYVNGMAFGIPPANITQLRKRQLVVSLSCNDDQTCNTIGGNLVCFDKQTGDFVDLDGTKGNIKTGHYTTKKGQKGNIYCDLRSPPPLPSSAYDLVGATSLVHASKTTLLNSDPSLLTQHTGSASSSNVANSAALTGNEASSSSSKTAATTTATASSAAISKMPVDSLFNVIFVVLLTTGMIAGSFLWQIFQL